MRMPVVGAGYLCSGHALSLAQMDHEVIGLDTVAVRIARLADETAPFRDPDAAGPLQAGHRGGRLTLAACPVELAEAEAQFLCVGTPQSKVANGSDLPFLPTVVEAPLPHLRSAASRAPV